MISDVTLSALANWLGSLTMILIVLYHVSCLLLLDLVTLRTPVGDIPETMLTFLLLF